MSLRYEITERPDYTLLTVHLERGQKVHAEPAAMASMDPTISLKAGLRGGLGQAFGRALGGENLIISTYQASDGPGEVTFASGPIGDVVHHRLTGNTLYLQRGGHLAHSDGVEVTGSWQGARGFFSGEGLILLKASGEGDVFFNSYGAILEIEVRGDYVVDTGYIVAFEDTLSYNVTVLPGLSAGGAVKSFLFGGEGLVCRFQGEGKVWIQTRYVNPFLRWIYPFRPVKKKSND